ncbi:hypothetical protein B0H14DRAFT_405784 [Mycena olivaceomarginata]|nr:hypothetical protein B0H14DRAFT_405784 [Mycena olivaceomarginata]
MGIQVRLADGTRLIARMNLTHTVGDLRGFIAPACGPRLHHRHHLPHAHAGTRGGRAQHQGGGARWRDCCAELGVARAESCGNYPGVGSCYRREAILRGATRMEWRVGVARELDCARAVP